MSYDAFISYSHSADGLLAPAVQDGLQRLAKPWNKRRALRVFRDDTGLSANPALWTSIVDALEESDWFLLFLSPAAAQSEWVNKEVADWLESRPPERIIPILTEGELVWDAARGDFDPAISTALPAALVGALREEPRHLDLRWAHDDDQLDLRNSRFRGAIADLAAPVHGIPKDELESEDVRLHRRARRLARAAVIALVVLLLASAGATAYALNQTARADEAAADARDEAERARAAEATADDQRLIADQQRAEAERQRTQAEDALARALTAEELAEYEAERALEQQLRAEEETVRAESEAVRALLAPLCEAFRDLQVIEDSRFLTIGELYESDAFALLPVTDANRDSLANTVWRSSQDLDIDGYGIVALEALWSFDLGDRGDREAGEYLDDPRSKPPYEWDYPVGIGEGPEAAYDYYDGYVVMTYDEAIAETAFVYGTTCDGVGL